MTSLLKQGHLKKNKKNNKHSFDRIEGRISLALRKHIKLAEPLMSLSTSSLSKH